MSAASIKLRRRLWLAPMRFVWNQATTETNIITFWVINYWITDDNSPCFVYVWTQSTYAYTPGTHSGWRAEFLSLNRPTWHAPFPYTLMILEIVLLSRALRKSCNRWQFHPPVNIWIVSPFCVLTLAWEREIPSVNDLKKIETNLLFGKQNLPYLCLVKMSCQI